MGEFNGHLCLRAEPRANGRTVLAEQSFRAPYHLSKPYWDADAQVLLVQVVNPTAGILSGDRLELELAVAAGAALLVTAPSASRVFKMKEGRAECRQVFRVAQDGWLEMMPEPLVPHRGSRYRQVTRVEVEQGAGLFFADLLVPGRVGHGEAWEWTELGLDLEVYSAGDLILRERLQLSGTEMKGLAEMAGMTAGACLANAILLGDEQPGDESWRREVAALHGDGRWVGLSRLRAGGWSLKVIASDGIQLRATMREVRRILSSRFPRLRCDPRKL